MEWDTSVIIGTVQTTRDGSGGNERGGNAVMSLKRGRAGGTCCLFVFVQIGMAILLSTYRELYCSHRLILRAWEYKAVT